MIRGSCRPCDLVVFLVPFRVEVMLREVCYEEFTRLQGGKGLYRGFLVLVLVSVYFNSLLGRFPARDEREF